MFDIKNIRYEENKEEKKKNNDCCFSCVKDKDVSIFFNDGRLVAAVCLSITGCNNGLDRDKDNFEILKINFYKDGNFLFFIFKKNRLVSPE